MTCIKNRVRTLAAILERCHHRSQFAISVNADMSLDVEETIADTTTQNALEHATRLELLTF